MKSVLITGCSDGGIGGALAEAFERTGRYHVFATARNTAKISTVLQEGVNSTVLELDVTSPESVEKAAIAVSSATGGTLDVLVNNSGLGLVGLPLLDVNVAQAKALFDVNFFGVLTTTQAFAPLLVKAKGMVVNHSSMVGSTYLVYSGIYVSSKSALTSLSETLRLEIAALGVQVMTLMTGLVSSKLFENQEAADISTIPQNSFYISVKQELEQIPQEIATTKSTPADEFARQVIYAIENGASGKVWLAERSAAMRISAWLIPTWLWDKINFSRFPFQQKLRDSVDRSRQSIKP